MENLTLGELYTIKEALIDLKIHNPNRYGRQRMYDLQNKITEEIAKRWNSNN